VVQAMQVIVANIHAWAPANGLQELKFNYLIGTVFYRSHSVRDLHLQMFAFQEAVSCRQSKKAQILEQLYYKTTPFFNWEKINSFQALSIITSPLVSFQHEKITAENHAPAL